MALTKICATQELRGLVIQATTIASILILISCSSTQPTPLGTLPQQNNSAIENWKIQGKLGLVEKGNSKSAFINWRQRGPNYRLELYGPFGRGRVTIEKADGIIELRDGDHQLNAVSAEELLYNISGLRMPVTWLNWWVRGLPSPDAPIESPIYDPDEATRLRSFMQGQWRLELSKYNQFKDQDDNAYALPSKVKITHPDYKLTFAIKSWELTAETGTD